MKIEENIRLTCASNALHFTLCILPHSVRYMKWNLFSKEFTHNKLNYCIMNALNVLSYFCHSMAAKNMYASKAEIPHSLRFNWIVIISLSSVCFLLMMECLCQSIYWHNLFSINLIISFTFQSFYPTLGRFLLY